MSIINQEPGFEWPTKSEILGQQLSTPSGSVLTENVVSTTKSLLSTTKAILADNMEESYGRELTDKTSTEAETFGKRSTVGTMETLVTELIPQVNSNLKSTFDTIDDFLNSNVTSVTEASASSWKQMSVTTPNSFKDIFKNTASPQQPFIGTEKPFVLPKEAVTEIHDTSTTTSTMNTIKDWLMNNSTEKTLVDSHTEETKFTTTGEAENIFNNTFRNELETTVTESSNINQTLKNILETIVSTEKPSTTAESLISDTTIRTLDFSTNIYSTVGVESLQTMNYTTTDSETITEYISNISSNITSGSITNTPASSNGLLDLDKDIVIYIVLGVILLMLIVGFVGIYLCCRKCKREQEVTGEYYTSQLKDYSDSSTKSPESISDTMINIKL